MPKVAGVDIYFNALRAKGLLAVRGSKASIRPQSHPLQAGNLAIGQAFNAGGGISAGGDIIGPNGVTFHYAPGAGGPSGSTLFSPGSHWIDPYGAANSIEWVYQGGGTWKNIA